MWIDFSAKLIQDLRAGCQKAKLTVEDVEMVDARKYTLVVRNEHGEDRSSLELHIKGRL